MAGYPSGVNTYVPSHDASGKLIVGFSRNPTKFAINKYMKMVPVKKGAGYYLVITAEEAARIINTGLSDFVWADGHEAHVGADNLESFSYEKYLTKRYHFPFTLGDKSVEQADWDILAVHAGIAAQKAMTARTIAAWDVLATTANWGSNTDTATNVGGGKLDVALSTTPYIKETFGDVAVRILQATLGVVQMGDLCAVMNPTTARLIAKSQEIIDQVKQSPFIMAQIMQNVPSQNGQYGLPDQLYGIKVVIEDAVRVTSRKGATKATTFCCPADTLTFLARPGTLLGMEGIPEFSTVQQFMYEEFTVESMQDVNNRRTVGRVVEDYATELCAPASGFHLTAVTN